MAAKKLEELEPLKSNQLCIGVKNFSGQEAGDLRFNAGDELWIVKPSEQMFWYIARNKQGETGMVPVNFLEPVKDAAALKTAVEPMASKSSGQRRDEKEEDGYIHMNPKEAREAEPLDMVELAEERERKRRLKPGTLVVGSHVFEAQKETDLGFGIYEEMIILKPLPDLCWYEAQKADQPERKGAIPITHVRLVYMSEGEDEDPPSPQETADDRLYDDMNDFISQSGWFSFPGQPHSKEALHRVLARKCKMSYEDFIACKEAVYKFDYTNGEKIFVGKARQLHVELSKHFDQFDEKSHSIREIDDELCHYTTMAGWNLVVWPIQEVQDLEFECAKRIIEFDCLNTKEEGNDHKLTDQIEFTSKDSFDKFWDWFCPST